MDRTMPSSTIERRSSGSITASSASVTCSLVGVCIAFIVAGRPGGHLPACGAGAKRYAAPNADRPAQGPVDPGEERLLFLPATYVRCGQIPPGSPPLEAARAKRLD